MLEAYSARTAGEGGQGFINKEHKVATLSTRKARGGYFGVFFFLIGEGALSGM